MWYLLAVLTFAIAFVIGLGYLYLTWNFNYWKRRGVKGPKPVVLLGNLPSLIKKHRNYNFELAEIYEEYKKSDEKFIGIFMTRNPVLLILDPGLSRQILTNKFKSFSNNEFSLWVNRKKEQISIRNPFLLRTDENWKEIRKDFIAGITESKLQQTYPILLELNRKMSDFITAECVKSNGFIEIQSLCYKCAVDFVADFVWGIDAEVFTSGTPKNPIFIQFQNIMDFSFEKIELFYLIGLMPFLKKLIKDRFFDEKTDNFNIDMQKKAIEMRLNNKSNRYDFLNYLLQLKERKNLSHIDVVGHSLTVVLDAVDTVAMVIQHTLFYLAFDQRVQQKLRMEINAHMDEQGEASFKTLLNMEYLDQCINESIRLTSPNPIFSKICTEETYLEKNENQSVKIDPGVIVHIPCFAYHHDPDIYPNPEEYLPERFDNGQAKILKQKGYFLPFSDGPRVCAGMRLGQMQSKAFIFEIIKKFQLRTCESTQPGKYPSRYAEKYYLVGDVNLEFIPIKR